MLYLITIKNTGDLYEYNKAFIYFRNSYYTIEFYKDNGHAHLLIKTTQYLSVFDFIKRFRCYLHFRQIRNKKEDIDRVRKYILKHKKGGDVDMKVGNVDIWIKKKENGKVVLTIQAPKWYDIQNNRMVITWTVEEFKQFLKYIIQETGITKIRVRKVKPTEQSTSEQSNKQYNTKQYKRKVKGKGKGVKVVKGFNKAVK